jgi:4-carboxymuconolactone decarboxylase
VHGVVAVAVHTDAPGDGVGVGEFVGRQCHLRGAAVLLYPRGTFDEVWERPELSKRDRSLATLSALIAMGNIDQLNFHLPFARDNGVTEQELIETITHLTFYAGWPKAISAMAVAKNAFAAQADN